VVHFTSDTYQMKREILSFKKIFHGKCMNE